MPNQGKVFLVFILGVISYCYSFAQLSADFSANPQQGCAPLVVSFSDVSTGGNITYREWTFGNGNTSIGNNANPTASYVNPGSYDVTLLVANATDTSIVTKPNFITVFQNPIPNFSVSPNVGCEPMQVVFTNTSMVPLIGINKFTWDFGDGTPTDSSFAPTHVYQNAGNFTVTLSVTDLNGCSATKDSVNVITVEAKPIADFTTIGPSTSCTAPFSVSFSNLSSGSNLSYNWFFQGGPGSSTQQNPSVTYTQTGQFYVRLSAVSPAGCADTAFKSNFINILPTQAQFTTPDTVCLGDTVFFQNTSVGATSYQWNLGNGQTPIQKNPNTTYNLPGPQIVSLIAQDGTQCTDTLTDTVFVDQVTANFSVDSNFSCSTPFSVQYIDQSSSNVVSWQWVWGNNIPFTSPVTVFGQSPIRTFFINQKSEDKLIVESAAGCKDSIAINHLVEVATPSANIQVDRIQGCQPLTINFSDTSQSVDPIDSMVWVIDTFRISNASADSFTFQNPGNYELCLKVYTSLGCMDSTCQLIKVGEKPIINFFTPEDSVCAGQLVNFYDRSQDSTKITEWQWDFSSNFIPPSNAQHPQIQLRDTGWISLSYTVGIDGCKDTVDFDSVIFVKGPLTEASFTFDCDNPYTVPFNGEMSSGNYFKWDFGDSTGYDSINLITSYTYDTIGIYEVALSAYDSLTQCSSKSILTVRVTDIQARFAQSDSFACAPATINFNASASQSVHAFSYKWLFGNGFTNSFAIQPTMSFTNSGTYQNRLIVNDVNGCIDTMIKEIHVFEPVAHFSVSSLLGCHPFSPTFSNSTLSDTTVNQFIWDFGNGDSAFVETPTYTFLISDSIASDSVVVFDTLQVSLFVKDTLGCSSIFSQPIAISRTNTAIEVIGKQYCVGDSIRLFDSLDVATNNFTWFLGNGDSLVGNPVLFPLSQKGAYRPYLKKSQGVGCVTVDSALSVSVEQGVSPLFTANPTDSSCYPVKVTFQDTTADSSIVKWYWQFSSGGNKITSTKPTVINTYNQPGKFTVTLISETQNGCKDSTEKVQYIKIDGPFGNVEVLPDTACKGDLITFNLKGGKNLGNYFLDFGDGNDTTLSESDSVITYTYDQIGTINPIVILTDSQQTCPQTRVKRVYIHEVIAGFQFTSDSLWCDDAEVTITDVSSGGNQIFYFLNNAPWSSPNSPLTITQTGTYPIKQVVIDNQSGCVDSIIKLVQIFPPPNVVGLTDTVLCLGDTMIVNLSGAETYQWSPTNGLMNDSGAFNVVYPQTNSLYQILAIDTNGCDTNLSLNISIQENWDFSAFGDTTIYQGETAFIGINASSNNLIPFWNPTNVLSCIDCYDPAANPLQTTTFQVQVTDPFGCFTRDTTILVEVDEAFSVALPTMFSPNGDGINDEILVRGWGIKELVTFEVYNRWGEMIFRSNDINRGWDGTHKGEPQNMDSYVYLVKAISYNGEEITDKGTITLIR